MLPRLSGRERKASILVGIRARALLPSTLPARPRSQAGTPGELEPNATALNERTSTRMQAPRPTGHATEQFQRAPQATSQPCTSSLALRDRTRGRLRGGVRCASCWRSPWCSSNAGGQFNQRRVKPGSRHYHAPWAWYADWVGSAKGVHGSEWGGGGGGGLINTNKHAAALMLHARNSLSLLCCGMADLQAGYVPVVASVGARAALRAVSQPKHLLEWPCWPSRRRFQSGGAVQQKQPPRVPQPELPSPRTGRAFSASVHWRLCVTGRR
jgi:hypothetical protein